MNKVQFERTTALNERPRVFTKQPHAPYGYDEVGGTKALLTQAAGASLVHRERGEREVERERAARTHGPSMGSGAVPTSGVAYKVDILSEFSCVEERLSGVQRRIL